MELTAEQTKEVASWVRDGADLNEVQKRIESDFDIRMTYMDVRFLVLDLDLEIYEEPEPEPEEDEAEEVAAEPEPQDSVTVELDKVVAPGTLVSGTVTFTDGVTSSWMLDQMGRLGLTSADPEYKPSEDDVAAFQLELQEQLKARGL